MKYAKSLFITFMFLMACATSAAAATPVNQSTFGGIAIKGYDPVSYFVAGKPQKGSAKFEASHNGAKWRFASAANRDKFVQNPGKYAPQYGGYCAWAVSQGYTANIDPHAWNIVGGKLYLNFSKSVQAKWEKDIQGHIRKANANWPKVLDK